MSSPDQNPPPPTTPTTATIPKSKEQQLRDNTLHWVAVGCTPIALGALFLPPRKLDLRFVVLAGTALWGTNRLTTEYSGRGLGERFGARLKNLDPTELPDKAKETQRLIREERARRQKQEEAEARRRRGGGEEGGGEGEGKGILEKVWMGKAPEDWKAKQTEREREALKEGGEGYWGLITWQIGEAMNELPWVASKNKKKEEEEGGQEGDKKDGK